jgi:hypothetical protein
MKIPPNKKNDRELQKQNTQELASTITAFSPGFRHYATCRKVTGSIPDEDTGLFN